MLPPIVDTWANVPRTEDAHRKAFNGILRRAAKRDGKVPAFTTNILPPRLPKSKTAECLWLLSYDVDDTVATQLDGWRTDGTEEKHELHQRSCAPIPYAIFRWHSTTETNEGLTAIMMVLLWHCLSWLNNHIRAGLTFTINTLEASTLPTSTVLRSTHIT